MLATGYDAQTGPLLAIDPVGRDGRRLSEHWAEGPTSYLGIAVAGSFFLVLTRFRLLLDDWRGYPISFFALVAVANVYMSSFGRLRQEVKSEKLDAEKKENELKATETAEGGSDEPAVPLGR